MILELHMLQNFAPSCLNRDDTNSPKDCEFGGYRRARISSQCQKRAIRLHFRNNGLLKPDDLADRSKRLILEAIAPRLEKRGRDREQAISIIEAAMGAVKLASDGDHYTQYLLYLGRREFDALADVIHEHWDALAKIELSDEDDSDKKTAKQKKSAKKQAVPAEVAKAIEAVFDGGKAADLALFGRMLADQSSFNIDAACQVAHAISTNRVAMEMDYFTAVDDLQPKESEEGAGAGMIGTVEFNSSCFYRYANIDLCQLRKNLQGDEDLATKTVTAFIHASIEAIPTGKQNTFAAHNPPDFIMAVARKSGQWNLANAFVQPTRSDDSTDLVAASAGKLAEYWNKLSKMFGEDNIGTSYLWRDDMDLPGFNGSRVGSVGDLIKAIEGKLSFDDCREVQ